MYRARSALRHGQMSEAFSTMVFLTLSGGLQDAYTYCVRGQVFANAQTGNIVLMSQRAFAGDLAGVLRYLIPLLAFALGVFAAEMVRRRCQEISRLHWRQMVVLAEIGLLLGVGFLPSSWDAPPTRWCPLPAPCRSRRSARSTAAHTPVPCASAISAAGWTPSAPTGTPGTGPPCGRPGRYFAVILIFALGAGFGGVASQLWGTGAIWASCLLLAVSFLLMFRQEIQAEADC